MTACPTIQPPSRGQSHPPSSAIQQYHHNRDWNNHSSAVKAFGASNQVFESVRTDFVRIPTKRGGVVRGSRGRLSDVPTETIRRVHISLCCVVHAVHDACEEMLAVAWARKDGRRLVASTSATEYQIDCLKSPIQQKQTKTKKRFPTYMS